MRIYWTLYGIDLGKLNLCNDLDINTLTFTADGTEHCMDIIGESDFYIKDGRIEGRSKSDNIDLNFPHQTIDELVTAFSHAKDIKLNIRISDECKVESARIVSYEAEIQIADVWQTTSGLLN